MFMLTSVRRARVLLSGALLAAVFSLDALTQNTVVFNASLDGPHASPSRTTSDRGVAR